MADTEKGRDETRDGGDISSGYGNPKSPASPVSDDKAQDMLYSGGHPQAGKEDVGADASGEGDQGDASDEGGTPTYAVDSKGNTLTVSDVAHNEQDPLA